MMLMRKPQLLLLDEHTSALDPNTQAKLMEQLACQVKAEELTTLMVTHNFDHALKYGNRLIVISHGKIVGDFKKNQKDKLNKKSIAKGNFLPNAEKII